MTGSDVLTLIVGVVFLGYGICVVVWRVPFTRFAKKMETTLYGRVGKAVSKRFSPSLIAFIGVFFIVFGCVGLFSLAVGSPAFTV